MKASTVTICTICTVNLLAMPLFGQLHSRQTATPKASLVRASLPAAASVSPVRAEALMYASESSEASSESTLVSSSSANADDALPDAPLPAGMMMSEYAWTLPAPAPLLPPCPKHITSETSACLLNPYHRFLDATTPYPLTVGQKGYLALRNFLDPGNLITISGTAAFTVATNSHTAYGPGLMGFARNFEYGLAQDATGEFFGTFLIPSITHEDPHYHREPYASVPHRFVHAVSRTFIAQSDTGRLMPNYATLLTYPISAETSNLYVPGVHGNVPSTVKRVASGLASDPINNLITEFLPDVARHINVRVIFVQRVVNMMTANDAGMTSAGSN